MRSNWAGRFTVAFETLDGRALVVRYRVPFNRYYTYITRWGRFIPNLLEAERIHSFYVCVTLRLKYCVRNSTTSNLALTITRCTKVTEDDLNEMLSGCPRRNYIRIPWRRLRRRTRREVTRECSRWWVRNGISDVERYLDDIAEELESDIIEYVDRCYGTFTDLIAEYGEFLHEIALEDHTECRQCRCTPQGRETMCIECPCE